MSSPFLDILRIVSRQSERIVEIGLPLTRRDWKRVMIDQKTLTTPFVGPNSVRLVRGFAALMGVLILLQAFLAGRGIYVDLGLFRTHRFVGMATLLIALIQVGVVTASLRRSRERSMLIGMSSFVLLLTVIQLGLGFSGKNNGGVAAWHVFNGVLLTGAIAAYANTVFRLETAPRIEPIESQSEAREGGSR